MQLERWLAGEDPKSLGSLGDVFEERTFAVAIVLTTLVSATPIPTGGITSIFQLNAIAIAARMVLGRRTIWLPQRWRHHKVGKTVTERGIPFFIRRITWVEKHSLPRWAGLFHRRLFIRVAGLIVIGLAMVASLAPPLSGLETLPALGAVVIGLAIILEDIIVFVIGVLIGTGGVVLFVAVGAAVVRLIQRVI